MADGVADNVTGVARSRCGITWTLKSTPAALAAAASSALTAGTLTLLAGLTRAGGRAQPDYSFAQK